MFDELGDGFTLFDFGAAEGAAGDIARVAEANGVPLKRVRDDAAPLREFYQARLILVRPDQFVAFASDGSASDGDARDAAAVIRRAVGGKA